MKHRTPLTRAIHKRAVTVTAETRYGFRVRAACPGTPPADDGTHLDPARKRPRARQTSDAIATAAGSVRVSGSGRHFILRDQDGNRLLSLYPCAHHIELRSAKKGICYGGADDKPHAGKKKMLTKRAVIKSHVGNGVSMVPFLWHTGGWAILLLTEDAPGSIRPMDRDGRVYKARNTSSLTDLVVMPAADMAAAVKALAELTGYAPVPPRWAMGFLHSRWGYRDADDIRRCQDMFRARKHPVDAFIYDFEWYTPRLDYGFKVNGRKDFADFSWNPRLFSDPPEDLAAAREQGIRSIGIRKPRLGNSYLLRTAGERGWRLKKWERIKGKWSDLHDAVSCRVIDFRNDDVRDWYWQRNRRFMEDGMVGWWNDEGEQFPTLYYWWNRAQADGQERDFPNTRFWSINRAYSAGLARTGATVWTGDSKTRWRDLRIEIHKVLNYGIAGMPWTACDLGGFSGNPKPELMTRYMQMGVFFPIMRTHSCMESTPRVPWNFGPDAEAAIREALQWRYRLLPYTNSLAHETATTGLPPARPMCMEFPGKTFQEECDQWMFGPAILAAPALDAGGRRQVLFPDGTQWFCLHTGARVAGGEVMRLKCGLHDMPAWQRGGSILPLAPVIQHSGELDGQNLELRIATGGDAACRLVEDDGVSLDYRRGHARVTRWTWNERTRRLRGKTTGSNPAEPRSRSWTLRFLGMGALTAVKINGKTVRRSHGQSCARGWHLDDDGTLVVRSGRVRTRADLAVEIE